MGFHGQRVTRKAGYCGRIASLDDGKSRAGEAPLPIAGSVVRPGLMVEVLAREPQVECSNAQVIFTFALYCS
jgi:hypothetical protein